MQTKLEQIAVKARSDHRLRFTSLCHHITPALLWESLNEIPYDTSAGTDRISLKESKRTFSKWSVEVIRQIHQGGYKPPAARRVYIPKLGKSEKRPINVPTIIDRVVQRSVTKVLNCIYEADFLKNSFGGRPALSAHHAIATIRKAITRKGVTHVYEADLKDFFGSLNHRWVEQFIDLRVGDPRIIRLIKRWLRAGYINKGEQVLSTEGAAQGGPISVLLSNIYLHYALDLWIENVVKPRLRGKVFYVRYLDDFILCFQLESDAKRFEQVLPKRLQKFSLSLQPSKTRLIPFGCYERNRSKRTGEPMQTFYFLGFTFFNRLSRRGTYQLGFKTERSRFRRSCMKLKLRMKEKRHKPLQEQILSINTFLVGTYRYYGLSGNQKSLKRLYYYTIVQWRKVLSTRSQRGNVNWSKYRNILSLYPIRRPRTYLNYRQLDELVLL